MIQAKRIILRDNTAQNNSNKCVWSTHVNNRYKLGSRRRKNEELNFQFWAYFLAFRLHSFIYLMTFECGLSLTFHAPEQSPLLLIHKHGGFVFLLMINQKNLFFCSSFTRLSGSLTLPSTNSVCCWVQAQLGARCVFTKGYERSTTSPVL